MQLIIYYIGTFSHTNKKSGKEKIRLKPIKKGPKNPRPKPNKNKSAFIDTEKNKKFNLRNGKK